MNIQPGFTASEGAGIFNWLRGFGATDKVDAKKKKNGKWKRKRSYWTMWRWGFIVGRAWLFLVTAFRRAKACVLTTHQLRALPPIFGLLTTAS
jgi:hypothetical protein